MAKITDPGKYTHQGNKPDGDAPTKRVKKYDHPTPVLDKLVEEKKKTRGRPKGSKNKAHIISDKELKNAGIEKITEHGFTYHAECGCLFTTAIKTRIAQYCKHGNVMNISEQADFTR